MYAAFEPIHRKPTLEVQYSPLETQNEAKNSVSKRATLRTYLAAYWTILLHAVLTVVLAFLAVFVVDGRKFLVNTQHGTRSAGGSWLLYQSDMTTIISAALVLVRLSGASWFTLAKYRSAFMHLERAGMTLGQISRTLRYGFPGWARLRRKGKADDTNPSNSYVRSLGIVWLAVLIIIPIQLISPLASGAFTWVPARMPSSKLPMTMEKAGNGLGWEYLVEFSEHQYITTLQSAGLAAVHTNARFESDYRPILRTYLPALRQYTPGSTLLGSATLPHFAINTFEWISDLDSISSDEGSVISSMFNDTNANLTFGSNANPFVSPSGTYVTATTLALNEPWPRPNQSEPDAQFAYEYPQPHTLKQSLLVGVFVARNDSVAMMKDCYTPEDKYGTIPKSIALYPTYLDPESSQTLDNCYAFARITFNAGMVNCTDCPIAASGTLEADLKLKKYQDVELLPDPLVSTAVHMIPETLMYLVRMNSTAIPTWQNLDGYAKGILSLAYQCNWNALQLKMLNSTLTYSTLISQSSPVVLAQVSAKRIYAWLGLNLLILLSGAILVVAQMRHDGEPVTDPQLYSLLLDATSVAGPRGEHISEECRNTGAPEKSDGDIRVKLLLPLKRRGGGKIRDAARLVPT